MQQDKNNDQVKVVIPSISQTELEPATKHNTNIFTWKNVRNSVPVGTRKKPEQKFLLDGISGMKMIGLSRLSRLSCWKQP